MELRELGKTGLKITPLGLGLAEISRQDRMGGDVSAAARVLNEALDNGINFLDTAACYGETEALIGDVVSHRRDEYVLATKAGHAVGGRAGRELDARDDRALHRPQLEVAPNRLRGHRSAALVRCWHVGAGGGHRRAPSRPRGGEDSLRELQRRQRGGQVGSGEGHIRNAPDQL